jgi:hypothetical protein
MFLNSFFFCKFFTLCLYDERIMKMLSLPVTMPVMDGTFCQMMQRLRNV